jgi:drug/metabolite transporter (DMT)-like permease
VTAPVRHVWAALLVVWVVWGSTYLAIKIVVDTMPPLLSAGSRFLVAGTLLAAILASRGKSLRVTPRELAASALAGLLLLTLGVGVVHVAETRIDSSVAAMIAGTVPLQVILLRLASHQSVSRSTRLSTLAGLAGLGLVVAPGLGAGSTALGLAIMISASVSWSLGTFFSGRLGLARDPFVATAYEMLAGGVLLTAGALAFGEWRELDSAAFAADSLAAWGYLIVVGSLVGFTAYAWLLRVAPISLVVTHQYVNPLVAIALGMLVLGERPSPASLAGALLVVGAVYVAVRAEKGSGLRRSPERNMEDLTPTSRPASVVRRGTPADQTA